MSVSKPLVIFFNPVRYAVKTYEALSTVVRAEIVQSKSRPEFFEDIKTKYKDAVAIFRTSATGDVCIAISICLAP
jgi:glyoxylate reductase